MIDSGSGRTTLIPEIIRHLDPPGGRRVRVVTPTTPGIGALYWVRFDFPEAGLAPFENVQVARLPMPPQLAQFHGLLGATYCNGWLSLDYEGRRGRYTLRDRPGPFAWLRCWL